MAGTRRLTVEILGDARSAQKAFDSIGNAGKSLGSQFTDLGKKVGLGLGAAAAGAVVFAKGAIDAAAESQKLSRQTDAIIKATGGAAGVTSKHIDKLTDSMSMKVGVDDEAIRKSANMLLTFKQVRNETGKGNKIFDRATGAMMDLANVFGSSDAAAMQLGKALSDPVKGISALRRAGVNFTQDQQDQIKSLVATGDILGAQKIILDEVENQVGGTAEAGATAADKMKVAWGNVQEKIGGALLPILEKVSTFITEKLIPGAEELWKRVAPQLQQAFEKIKQVLEPIIKVIGEKLADAIRRIGKFASENKGVVAAFIGVLAGAAAIAGIVALGAAIASLFNPVTLIIIGIAALAAGIVYAYNHFEGFRNVVQSVIDYFKTAWPDIQKVIQNVFEVIRGLFDLYVGYIKWVWNTFGDDVLKIVQGIFNVLKGVFDFFLGLFSGDWGRMLDGLVSAVTGIGGVLAGAFGAAFELVRTVVVGAVQGIWEGIKFVMNVMLAGWQTMINGFIDGVNTMIRGLNILNPLDDIPKIHHVSLPRLAKGGIVTGPTTALIGEAGPEAVIPLSKASGMGIGDTNITINVAASPLSSPADVGAAVVDALQAWSRRNGSLPAGLVA